MHGECHERKLDLILVQVVEREPRHHHETAGFSQASRDLNGEGLGGVEGCQAQVIGSVG
jgi:hypothetical protein